MGRLHMETMGLVFFHLCSQTCPGRELWAGQDVASRKVLREGSGGCGSHWQVSLCAGMEGGNAGLHVPCPGTKIELEVRGSQLLWADSELQLEDTSSLVAPEVVPGLEMLPRIFCLPWVPFWSGY